MDSKSKVEIADHEIRQEFIADQPRGKLWRAMTNRELLARWWGRGNPVDVKVFEPHAGGFWHYIEHADGEEYSFRGRFREIVPEERIVQTFEFDGMPGHVLVDITILEDLGNGRTRIKGTSQFHTNEERDGMLGTGMTDGAEQSWRELVKVAGSLPD